VVRNAGTRTPPAIVGRLNEALRQAMQDPEIAKRLAEQGGLVRPGSPEDFTAFIAEEVKAWGDIVQAAKVSL
jgi:tripartite-type tricarboxylate transporter receptor subunit TctC